MVVIRLSRTGRKNLPLYRIMVADQRRPRDGKCIESLGWYNPRNNVAGQKIKMNLELFDQWVKKGAQPSDTVKKLAKDLRANI